MGAWTGAAATRVLVVWFPGLKTGTEWMLRSFRSVFPLVGMPGTVPVLVYCQMSQVLQPPGTGGRDPPYAATHSGVWPRFGVAQVFHQSAVVYKIGSRPVLRMTSLLNALTHEVMAPRPSP